MGLCLLLSLIKPKPLFLCVFGLFIELLHSPNQKGPKVEIKSPTPNPNPKAKPNSCRLMPTEPLCGLRTEMILCSW